MGPSMNLMLDGTGGPCGNALFPAAQSSSYALQPHCEYKICIALAPLNAMACTIMQVIQTKKSTTSEIELLVGSARLA